jgi:hypothetical protein
VSERSYDLSSIASKSFDFMAKLFKDVGNLLILIVLNVIPIVNFIVLGYYVRVVRVDADEPPKVSDFGGLFIEGLKLVILALIYFIVPIILLAAGVGTALIAGWVIAGWGSPFWGRWFLAPIAFLFLALAVLLFFVILFFSLPAFGLYMRTGDFSKAFAFGEAWDIVRRFGLFNYILFFILLAVFNAIASAIGSIIPWFGAAIVGVFAMAFSFKAVSLLVNLKYPVPPPPPPQAQV